MEPFQSVFPVMHCLSPSENIIVDQCFHRLVGKCIYQSHSPGYKRPKGSGTRRDITTFARRAGGRKACDHEHNFDVRSALRVIPEFNEYPYLTRDLQWLSRLASENVLANQLRDKTRHIWRARNVSVGVSLFCWGPRDGLLKVPNLENANKIKRRERQIVRCCLLGRAATYSCYRISLYPRLFSFLFISDKGVSLATRCWKQPWNVVERLDVAPVLFFFMKTQVQSPYS